MEIKKKPKKPTVSKLKAKLDAVFSQFIRLCYADDHGYCTCYTCGKRMHWTKIQNGHLYSRGRYATRYDPDNCRPQCSGCNVMAHGNYQEYFPRMIEEVGEDELMALHQKSLETVRLSVAWYNERISHYTAMVNGLKIIKGDHE